MLRSDMTCDSQANLRTAQAPKWFTPYCSSIATKQLEGRSRSKATVDRCLCGYQDYTACMVSWCGMQDALQLVVTQLLAAACWSTRRPLQSIASNAIYVQWVYAYDRISLSGSRNTSKCRCHLAAHYVCFVSGSQYQALGHWLASHSPAGQPCTPFPTASNAPPE